MNLSAVDLNLLLVFEALFEEREVTAAARRIGIGQPGMSAALGRLRAVMGDALFVRAAGEMRPTPKAFDMAPCIAAALAQLRVTLDAGIGFDPAQASRAFTIGSTDYAAAILLPALVAHVRTAAPGIDLRVVGYEKGAVAGMLDRGEIDVALGVFPAPPERAVVTALFEECFVGLARRGHPAIQDGRIDAESFARLPHVLVTVRRDTSGSLDEALAACGLKRRVALTVPYFLVLPAVLQGSDLLAALPSRLGQMLVGDSLQQFALPIRVAPWTVSMLWLAMGRNDQAARWLRRAIAGSLPPPTSQLIPRLTDLNPWPIPAARWT